MARCCRLGHCSKVGRSREYTGRDGGHLSEAAPDPLRTFDDALGSHVMLRAARDQGLMFVTDIVVKTDLIDHAAFKRLLMSLLPDVAAETDDEDRSLLHMKCPP
jgi:hypothetical protein